MKKILKVALVLMMAFGIQLASLNGVSAQENGTLPDGSYIVSTVLKNASNINNDSMAAGALADEGTLEIIDGKWYLIAEFKRILKSCKTQSLTNGRPGNCRLCDSAPHWPTGCLRRRHCCSLWQVGYM